MDTPPPPDSRPPEKIFLESLPVIEEIIAYCSRRFSPQDGEDFSQTVMARLIEEDYRILREFRGRSSLRTYLAAVIPRMMKDYQNHLWGKWHPSAEAKRLGPVAMLLEQLLYRDWLSFDEACREMLGKNPDLTREMLEDLAAKLPPRIPRRLVDEEQLDGVADREMWPDERLEAKERGQIGRRVWGKVLQCIKARPPEDQVLLWLRLELSVAEIARFRQLEQKPLYRRLDKIYSELRNDLEKHGVRRQDVEAILGRLQPGFLDF